MHNIKRNQAPHPPHPKHTQRLNSSLPQKEELNERKQKKKILHPHESGPICSHLASSLIDVLHWWWCTQLQKIFHRFRSCLIRTKPQLQPGGKDGMEKKKGEKVERDLFVLSFSLSLSPFSIETSRLLPEPRTTSALLSCASHPTCLPFRSIVYFFFPIPRHSLDSLLPVFLAQQQIKRFEEYKTGGNKNPTQLS